MFRHALAAALTVVLTATACASGVKSVEVKSGPGVTDESISLGVLTDMSGPFSPTALVRIKGYELFIGELNARGGICGRKVELVLKDHGFNVQRALDGYFDLEPKVLGFLDLTGAAMTTAIAPDLIQTRALAAPVSWSAALLGNPNMMIVGGTYDIDVMNGLDHLKRTGAIADGDTIGHVHVDGDFGSNALEGSTFAAQQWNLTLVERSVTETADNLTTQIAAMKAAGAKAVVLSTSPAQTALAVIAAANLGWNVPFLVNVAGYDPAILKSLAAPAVMKQVQVVSPIAPYGADAPGPQAVAKSFQARYPDVEPNGAVNHGYVVATAFAAVLEKACADKDLTRDGVIRAFQATNGVETHGLTGPLRFSVAGRPSATQSYIARPDDKTKGGLAVTENLFESDLVKAKGTRAK
ncbi:ABC transporter substrate-binding protein [Umezawaea tangerina]|uniref:Amino acid/amide ABC transporter substrate-binding protein (HAAT family) n=1 Tax=Umezawaea tangerina TaxID=84725 RepID=A0A2T0T4Z8_9PSEU|nr:ABC transporter substrate-binding protein [Umezawaea tangerina]PRY40704.1 amino acid/amide ABC transporter substrate-binding protein (HAAT family) [Umezawaea tangerina]